MLFVITITDPKGTTLLSDLFHMDSRTELYQRLSFLNTDVTKESLKNVFKIQISDVKRTVLIRLFPNIVEAQLNKTRIYEQIAQKQDEYIAQNRE
ncbi:MAG TPA: hypothetical protein ENH87_00625 [Pricia antarctica]|uniref:Uncharacterized protein n=1 Tax=Pricia antarctica TaxID=641691 RepID=A0A831VL86_9FLAO|nr:hypothetical protein [Pricia antarctica]